MLHTIRFSFRLSTLLLGFMFAGSALVGCGGSTPPAAAERLPGKWHGEMIVYEDAVAGKLPPEKVAELTQMQMDFEFRPDGSMALSGVTQGQSYSEQGRWSLVKQDGELLTIKSIEKSGTEKDINIEFDGTDTFYIPLQTEVAELGAMRFTRMR
jgi:hypothetical protein